MDNFSSDIIRNIINIYDEYLAWSKKLLLSMGGTRAIGQMLTGGAEYKNREEHAEFYHKCEAAVGEYSAALADGSADRASLMPFLKYILIDVHADCDERAEWMLLAAERHYLPFLELLTAEEAAELFEPYRKLRRRNKGLPPQDEMMKKLKKLQK